MKRFQLSQWHLSRQYLSWQHLSISGISHLLLAWFWPNFKSRFLEPFLTYTNCHSDICPGNICPGDICPYQGYFSCYWPNFDQTFLAQLFESLNFLAQYFASPKFFWTQQFFSPKLFWQHLSIRNISAVNDLILTNLFGQHFFGSTNFWGPNFL